MGKESASVMKELIKKIKNNINTEFQSSISMSMTMTRNGRLEHLLLLKENIINGLGRQQKQAHSDLSLKKLKLQRG
jgi:hypothetical protein